MTVIDRTQCPSCQTVYRISTDQISMADGRVRCGACLNVFDGTLQGWSTEAIMHATEETGIDPSLLLDIATDSEPELAHFEAASETSPALADEDAQDDPPITDEALIDSPVKSAEKPRKTPRRTWRRSPKLDLLWFYGRWWLLGGALGGIVLTVVGWLIA